MAERVFPKSPGIFTREIDLSQPSTSTPTGVPAGIIGTAERGPAFVPQYFGSQGDYTTIFGNISSDSFGSLAANQWLTQGGESCLYVRVLGIGDGTARNTDGTVTRAGFTVGGDLPQPNDIEGPNTKWANYNIARSIAGRTYFLGCFMSESNGSTIFSDAGLQSNSAEGIRAASAVLVLKSQTPGDFDGPQTAFTLTSTDGTERTYQFAVGGILNTGDVVSGTTIRIQVNGITTYSTIADQIIAAINHSNGHGAKFSIVKSDGSNTGDTLTITQATSGYEGNTPIPAITNGDAGELTINGGIGATTFQGGLSANHSVPILRAVILAASGVVLHLSGCSNHNGNDVANLTDTAISANGKLVGRVGGLTGSVNLTDSTFTIIMNGYKPAGSTLTDKNGGNNPYITASFDPTSEYYFTKNGKINRDPSRLEECGHLLLSHFEIQHGDEGMAHVTGSGVVTPGHVAKGDTISSNGTHIEDVAFLLTSSIERGASDATLNGVPDYEDFRDRFSSAETPFIISQKFGGRSYDLFKLIRLDDGEVDNHVFPKITQVQYKTDSNLYGSFNIDMIDIYTGESLESHSGLSLDPSSPNYIARILGDQNIYFDFDNAADSQKIIVEGSFPKGVNSNYFRVKMSDDLLAGNISNNAIPMGFRGPGHLVTSGSLMAREEDNVYQSGSLLTSISQPPFPYAKNINKLENGEGVANTDFYWGVKVARSTLNADTNANAGFNPETAFNYKYIDGWTRYYPSHRTSTAPMFAKNRAGDNTSSVTLLDSDRFNYNLFSLEHIKIATGSSTTQVHGANLIADPLLWSSSSYVRSGIIATDDDERTRAFEPRDLTNSDNQNFAQYLVPVLNGFNGLNIFNQEKSKLSYRATKMEIDDSTSQGGLKGPTVSAYRKAIDILTSKADADIQVLSIPGQRHPTITDYAISAVESRFDSLLVMDIEERDKFNLIASSSDQKIADVNGVSGVSITHTVNDFKARNVNTSFAAAYFPDVTLKFDGEEISDVPPSVMALGAIAKSDSTTGVSFFAPAGESRSIQNSVIDVSGPSINTQALNELVYEANINPIIAYNSGPFINGQKTAYQTQSALDRVDVRRLLIDVRRKVRKIANTLLFEPNRAATLEKFTNEVNPIMSSYRNAGGISRYKVVIDSSTTTQADVENNTIRGKIYLQPINSIEFVALDFQVQNTD